MSAQLRALSAEMLKLRGTLALWMCVIAPAVVVGLYVLQVSFSKIVPQSMRDPPSHGSFSPRASSCCGVS